MALHIIIDGYNLIRQSPWFQPLEQKSLEEGRNHLIAALSAYKRVKAHAITLVFDAANGPYLSLQEGHAGGIRVIFSRQGESADEVIQRMAQKEKNKAIVVSSDRAIVDYAARQGAATISSERFEEKIRLAQLMEQKGLDVSEAPHGWVPTTRKKGPGRRLTKRERRNRLKTNKL